MTAAAEAPAQDTLDHILIDPYIQKLLPPLDEDVFDGLKASIMTDGRFTEPLLVWHDPNLDGDILIDGHHRLGVWRELVEQGITFVPPPRVERITTLSSRAELERWIIEHQLRKRNVAPGEASILRAKLTRAIQKQGAHNPAKKNPGRHAVGPSRWSPPNRVSRRAPSSAT